MPMNFTERLSRGALLCDGAMGTQLYARGVHDVPLELANLNHPDMVRAVHLDYLQVGAEMLETNTFGANAARLALAGIEDRVAEINKAGVELAQQARALQGQQVWIAGAMGPLGRDGVSTGVLDSGSGSHAFAEHAAVLAEAGVDLFVLETFTSLAELRLALQAL